MRGLLRAILILLAAVVGLGAALALAAVAGALIPGRLATVDDAGPPVHVGLIQGPIHTDLLLPLDPATRAAFGFLDLPPSAEWLAVGWGAQSFYTTVGDYDDLTAGAVWNAVTGDSAVMRFEPVGPASPPRSAALGPARYGALLAQIRADTLQPFAHDLLAPGDVYYTAPGRFHGLNTCNQWVSRSLRASGQPFGIWTPTTWSVRLSHWWFGP